MIIDELERDILLKWYYKDSYKKTNSEYSIELLEKKTIIRTNVNIQESNIFKFVKEDDHYVVLNKIHGNEEIFDTLNKMDITDLNKMIIIAAINNKLLSDDMPSELKYNIIDHIKSMGYVLK